MRKRALVVGLGISGMSAAIGLRRAGWTPVIVERAPERRTGGYFVGLFPEGRQAAVDLGITDHLHTRNPQRAAHANSWSVDRRGRRRPALGFLDRPGDPAAVLRGDIEAALWQNITGVEVWFGATPVAITEGPAAVQVLLEQADTGAQYRESFDMVVGADGMRSSVRRIVFGPDEDYLTTWNAMICAFQLKESSLRGGAALGAALLKHPDDLAAAMDAWATGLRPFITKHQRTARLEQQMFVPSSRRAEALRSVLLGLIRRIRGRRPATEAGGPRPRALSGTSR